MLQNLSSAAVMIGALRVNIAHFCSKMYKTKNNSTIYLQYKSALIRAMKPENLT